MSSGTLYTFTLPTTCEETGEHLPHLPDRFIEKLADEGFTGATISEASGAWITGGRIEREPVQTAQVFHTAQADRAARLVCDFVKGYARQREVFAIAQDAAGVRYVGSPAEVN